MPSPPVLVTLPILASTALESKPPGFQATKRLYKQILERICSASGGAWAQLVPESTSTRLHSDGYHLNQKGSEEVAGVVAGASAGLLLEKVRAAGKAS